MSQGEKKGNPVPNWLLFLFAGTFVWGVMYFIFMHGFLGYSQPAAYQAATGTDIVKASLPEKPVKDAASIANGEASSATCAACHGQGLTGGIGPNLMDEEWLHGKKSETELYRLIMQGVAIGEAKQNPPKGAMPARGTLAGGRQVWEVIYYLSSKNKSIVRDSQ